MIHRVGLSLRGMGSGITTGGSSTRCHPFPLPLTDVPCQTIRMKNLTATLCLTIAVLLGSAGVSWSADLQKGFTAYKSGDHATALREWKSIEKQRTVIFVGGIDLPPLTGPF